jgi:hypothetical protein
VSHPPSRPSPVAAPGSGRLILLSTVAGTVLLPVAVWCLMLLYDQFDPMCGAGGEGRIACAARTFVVTAMAVLPGLVIGVLGGLRLASRRAAKASG